MNRMRAIIPAAGFGTRSIAKPRHSKEMLSDPFNYGKPLIEWSLELCKIFNMEPLIITREEKKDLRQYLYNKQVKFIDIEVNGEWNESVLKSKDHWAKNNVLILPDTRFDSIKCIDDIQRGLDLGNNAVMALHNVEDASKWGIIKDYTVYEKPQHLNGIQSSWGVLGFSKNYGVDLFSNMNHYGFKLNNVGFTYLKKFEDLTRSQKLTRGNKK